MDKLLASNKIYIGKSKIPNAGRGVFAAKNIKMGEIIERCPVIIIPKHDMSNVSESMLVEYFFSFGARREQLVVALGFGSIYNHTQTPNARYKEGMKQKVLDFIALRSIKKDDEITIDYNPHSSEKSDPLWFKVSP